MTLDETWDYLVECGIANAEELRLVTTINGHNIDTLNSVLFTRTAYRSIEQMKECEK